MGTYLEAPTWPPITADEAAAVVARFPAAGRVESLRWHSPRPFSAATLVRTSRGEFFLKRHHRQVRSPEGLSEEHAFMAYLAAAGAAVPEVMRTATGASAIAVGDWRYELHREAPGEDLYRDRLSWTPFLTLDHAHAAGVAMARLHVAAGGFEAPARTRQPLVASFTILPAADPLAAAEAYVAAQPALAAFLAGRGWQRQLNALFAASGAGLAARLADRPSLWTHNDWHPSNLSWSRGKVRAAFDFGLADRTCVAHDLATAIERTAVAWLKLGQGTDDGIGDPEAALALLAGYAAVLPLDRAEREAIVHLLPLVHIEFALSEIAYFAGVLGDAAQAALAWEQYLIGHAEWFLTPPGLAFLRWIGGG